MASAVSRIKLSLTLQPNLFQLFHRIGGVCASGVDAGFLADCAATIPNMHIARQMRIMETRMHRCLVIVSSCVFPWRNHLACGPSGYPTYRDLDGNSSPVLLQKSRRMR